MLKPDHPKANVNPQFRWKSGLANSNISIITCLSYILKVSALLLPYCKNVKL